MNNEPDLAGYSVYFRYVGDTAWIEHSAYSVAQLPTRQGRTGKQFTLPDKGKVYEVIVRAYDDALLISGYSAIITIDTETGEVSIANYNAPLFQHLVVESLGIGRSDNARQGLLTLPVLPPLPINLP